MAKLFFGSRNRTTLSSEQLTYIYPSYSFIILQSTDVTAS